MYKPIPLVNSLPNSMTYTDPSQTLPPNANVLPLMNILGFLT